MLVFFIWNNILKVNTSPNDSELVNLETLKQQYVITYFNRSYLLYALLLYNNPWSDLVFFL